MSKCRGCGAEIDWSAKACPKCGAQSPTVPNWILIPKAILAVAVLGWLLYWVIKC